MAVVLYDDGTDIQVDDEDIETRSHVFMEAGGDWTFEPWTPASIAEQAPSAATKASPGRVIWSASKTGSLFPYVYMAVADDEKLEIGFRNDAGNSDEDTSAGVVTIGVHSLSLEFDGSDLVAYVDTVEVARVTLAGTFVGLDTATLGGISTFFDGHSFDEKMGELWGHAGVDFPGYTVLDRKDLHNHLASVTDGLGGV